MKNLDDYLSTTDELFNTNAQNLYFSFSGHNKPNTDKTFEVFVKALHEVYFFIQDNLNKPFGCIEKINEVSTKSGFNEVEKLILIDDIIQILGDHPEYDKQGKVHIHLIDHRDGLSPYMNNPEIQNPNWHFDFEAIKEKLNTIETPTERHKYLMNILFDYSAKGDEIEEVEHQYYESLGFVRWIITELSRCEYEQELEVTVTIPKTEPVFKLSDKKGAKTDLIRVLNALYEIRLINKADGQLPTKQEFIEALGGVLGVDLSSYHSNLSQAMKNQRLN